MGWRPDLQEEIQNAEMPEAGWHGCWEHQQACLEVLSAEDGALSDRRISALDEITSNSPVLVVPMPQADKRSPLEEVSEVEGGAENPVGGGVQGDGKREGAVESSRAFCGSGVQSGGAGFPFLDGCREDSAGCGSG